MGRGAAAQAQRGRGRGARGRRRRGRPGRREAGPRAGSGAFTAGRAAPRRAAPLRGAAPPPPRAGSRRRGRAAAPGARAPLAEEAPRRPRRDVCDPVCVPRNSYRLAVLTACTSANRNWNSYDTVILIQKQRGTCKFCSRGSAEIFPSKQGPALDEVVDLKSSQTTFMFTNYHVAEHLSSCSSYYSSSTQNISAKQRMHLCKPHR
ncbi:uncharacterized protein LOC112987933 isoform X2 [Dromaius novaehollandiae]|uniref:uncharacterized protein LOC112987933 isoform X2 n=1 Tax=Dromaius novaehollandiae TaxID=8790 RepID=UPI00311DA52D